MLKRLRSATGRIALRAVFWIDCDDVGGDVVWFIGLDGGVETVAVERSTVAEVN